MKRHEVQPDVYCRRLNLRVPVAVSVKDGQMADLFHVICGIALRPFVTFITPLTFNAYLRSRLSAIPGSVEGALTPAARIRHLVTWTALFGGLTASLMMVYRTMFRPGGILGTWSAPWVGWLAGRRDL